MPPKAKGKAKVTQKESKESYSQDSAKTPSWFELIRKNDQGPRSSSKTKTPDQSSSRLSKVLPNQNQNLDQKVSIETTSMLPMVSMDEIARTNALVLANIFSQNKEMADLKAP